MDFIPNPENHTDKKAWRAAFKAARQGLSSIEKERQNEALARQLLSLPELIEARIIHTYWPLGSAGEIDTKPVIQSLLEQGKQIVLPVVLSYDDWKPGRSRLEHRLYTSETNMKTNRWGINEPINGAIIAPIDLDAVIVPALGVDRLGRRIGYGRGYYDELLASCSCPTICPVWESCLMDRVPADTHDIPVHIIATATQVLRPYQGQT